MSEGMRTNARLTKDYSGARVSYIAELEDRDYNAVWIVFQDGRVLEFDSEYGSISEYPSVELATIDAFGTSEERRKAGLC